MLDHPKVKRRLLLVASTLASALMIAVLYWAILGLQLDRSIQRHIAECEEHIADKTRQHCVMTFIPTETE
jgi:hypothetical protein